MEDSSKFKIFNVALAKHFLAEQKMIRQSQITLLAHNKLIRSAQLLHLTVLQLKEIPENLKHRLQHAIASADINKILTLSRQIQDTIARLYTRNPR